MIKFFTIIFILFSIIATPQDVHYSQFDKTRSLINPSLIANQNQDYEIQIQRRSQWSSVSIPFNTTSLSFNAKQIYKNLSLGSTVLKDIAGDSHFSTNGLALSFVNSINTQANSLSFGFQIAGYQRALNYENLIFLQNEQLENTSFSFFDIGIGFSNYKQIDKNKAFLVGISYFHLNKPKQSLMSNDNVVLSPKKIVHSTYYSKVSSKTSLSPTLYVSSQAQDQEVVFGSGVSYHIKDDIALQTGLYSRIKDAVFLTLGIEKENLELIVSYDINTSSLNQASNYMGAFEFSICYGWQIIKEKSKIIQKICPQYL
tara:strand:+ start:16174 stop:17115 length:942 start_codon:yes stop_codon:yes gene_type:complete